MDIRLKPEMEEMIRRNVERGAYRSVNEFVEHAVALLHEEESWLAENASDIRRSSSRALPPPNAASCWIPTASGKRWSKERVVESLKSAAHEPGARSVRAAKDPDTICFSSAPTKPAPTT